MVTGKLELEELGLVWMRTGLSWYNLLCLPESRALRCLCLQPAGRGPCLCLVQEEAAASCFLCSFLILFFSYCCAFCAVFIFLLSLCILAACAVEVGLACRISACVSCSSSGILTSSCIPPCEMGTMVGFCTEWCFQMSGMQKSKMLYSTSCRSSSVRSACPDEMMF